MAKNAYIILEDGHVFCGKRFGADSDAVGEIVFTTGMGGYIETLTDPSYYGQIVLQTFPMIGNCGMIFADVESRKSYVSAYIVKEWCEYPSNFRLEQDLDSYLKEEGIPGIYDVDTREITRILREKGTMAAKIVSELPENATDGLADYKIKKAVAAVASGEKKIYNAKGDKKYTVAVYDFGDKSAIVKELTERGCEVISMPYSSSAEEILSLGADGLVISNGPGDPCENEEAIAQIKKLMGKIPVFGVCLGHELMALCQGGEIIKLKYGHRGANQPVKNIEAGIVSITNQNHGFAVKTESVACAGGVITHENANDGTCEGIEYTGLNAFSVQFHPIARDKKALYDKFMKLMGGAF
ncbi:MAG: glutamine-hydrolyzing carbamoyl-phosphate synthase small subunit [Ruminococcaceae bacterium]|nr:glutamine-hydrolyzing carbamoyl-phosphate synthase small subunit [Oscillospiraceae bacterium]